MFGFFRARRFRVDIASFSECGLVRPSNQDHIFVNRRGLVFCVADGMGGGEGGAEASDIICQEIAASLKRRMDFGDRVRAVDESIRRADTAVRVYAKKAGFRQMGSTVTVMIADSEDGRSAAVGNIGDSRIYRFRAGVLKQLTDDHTMVDEIRRRTGRGMTVYDARTAMFSHVLTRAVGVGSDVRADWRKIDMRKGDAYLVCSDGVHGVVPQDAIRGAFALGGKSAEIAERIRDLVLACGAPDNFSAIVVQIGGRR